MNPILAGFAAGLAVGAAMWLMYRVWLIRQRRRCLAYRMGMLARAGEQTVAKVERELDALWAEVSAWTVPAPGKLPERCKDGEDA